MSMFEGNSITELPLKLTQNGLDYIAKQYQTIYDAYFGSENDNSEEPLITPLILNGTGYCTSNVWFFDSSAPDNYYAKFLYDIHVYGDSQPESYVSNIRFDVEDSHSTNPNVTGNNLARCDAIAQDIDNLFTINAGNNFATPVTLRYSTESNPFLTHYTNFPNYYDETIFSVTSDYRNFGNVNKVRVRPVTHGTSDLNFFSSSDGLRLNLLKETQFYTNTCNNQVVNNIVNNNDYSSDTYTTISGDTITYYYNDYSVIIPSSGGGGVGIGGVGGIALGYVDIESIFGSLIDNLTIKWGNEGGDVPELHFPTYDEIKFGYIDQGDFYIEPIEQIPVLPVAPSFDVDLDVGTFPQTIGQSVQSVLDIADSVLGVGGSALLLGSLFFSFLWIKLKRR